MVTDTDLTRLEQAADLLSTVGRTAADGRVAIRCLLATDALQRAGVRVAPPPSHIPDVRSALTAALQCLGDVDDTTLDDDDVIDAMHQALLAHVAAS